MKNAKRQEEARPATVAEVKDDIAHLEAEIIELNRRLDAEEVIQGQSLDDATAFRLSIQRCIGITAEIDRFEKLLLRTQGELEAAEAREREVAAADRRVRVAAWDAKAPAIYADLDTTLAAVAKAIEVIEAHQVAGRQLGLRIVSDLDIIIHAAVKASVPSRRLRVDSMVYAARASTHAHAYYDPENPKPAPEIEAPAQVFAIHDSPPTPWQLHEQEHARRRDEYEKRQAENPPAWVGR